MRSFSRSLVVVETIFVAVFLSRHALVSSQVVNNDNEDSVSCLRGIKESFVQVSPLDEWDFSNISVGSICNFSGVSCWNTRETKILSLDLSGWNLSGEIPDSLIDCRYLQSLDLSNNALSGLIPTQLCTWLPNLVTLNLSVNSLYGSIPPTLDKCRLLADLWLSNNLLSGHIPNELSTLKRLTRLSLSFNKLTGRIPAGLDRNLVDIDFGGNRLCGQPSGRGCGGWSKKLIIIVSFGVFAAAAAAAACILLGLWRFKFLGKQGSYDIDHEVHQRVPGMPSMFSYDDIKDMTANFSNKLGQGGFGSVFAGILADGLKVAVKRLDGLVGPIKDESFFAEVKSIGSIHHVNLVRLLGFCTEMSHRLLVYEYMANGSLERWIFGEFVLTWQQRKNIMMDIAKGLNYLHVECHQKIIHLDIKPQNILLNENFDAKVSDFGLSKLIDKKQSRVMMAMRGTPGYMAPEWLNGVITEKVDVYSFGVVILEIICGRKVFEIFCDEEDRYLLTLLKRKKEEDRLLDIVNILGEELRETGVEEVNDMVKLAAWCLQGDYNKRPSMSMVIKVLEGAMQIEDNLDYNFWNKPVDIHNTVNTHAPTQVLASVLSAPR